MNETAAAYLEGRADLAGEVLRIANEASAEYLTSKDTLIRRLRELVGRSQPVFD